MTPKEKAKELVEKFKDLVMIDYRGDEEPIFKLQKQCALIAVDEMIIQNGELYLNSLGDKTIDFYREKNTYLFGVKQEIEKL
jgi:hypothetical protein